MIKDINSAIEHFQNRIEASNKMIEKYGVSSYDQGVISAYEDAINWLKAIKEKHAK